MTTFDTHYQLSRQGGSGMIEWIDFIGRWLVIGLGVACGLSGIVYGIGWGWAYALTWLIGVTKATKAFHSYRQNRHLFEYWMLEQQIKERELEKWKKEWIEQKEQEAKGERQNESNSNQHVASNSKNNA
jgi:uncharacterized membrane protein YhiD involved in acid resistance